MRMLLDLKRKSINHFSNNQLSAVKSKFFVIVFSVAYRECRFNPSESATCRYSPV